MTIGWMLGDITKGQPEGSPPIELGGAFASPDLSNAISNSLPYAQCHVQTEQSVTETTGSGSQETAEGENNTGASSVVPVTVIPAVPLPEYSFQINTVSCKIGNKYFEFDLV